MIDFYLIFLFKVVQKVLTIFRHVLLLFNGVLNFKFLWISKCWEVILQIPKSLSSGNQHIQNFVKTAYWTQSYGLFLAKCWYVVKALYSFSDIHQQGKMEVPFHSFRIVFSASEIRSLPSSEIPKLKQINYWKTASSLGHIY